MNHARPFAILVGLLAGALSGCVGLKPLRTQSGNPEITIQHARPPELIAGLGASMARRGYEQVMVNERVAVFAKDCGDFDTAFFYGEGWNASADFRVTFYTQPDSLGLLVLTEIEIVTDAGTSEEGRKPAPQGHPEAHELQDMLETLQADLALRRHAEQWPDEPARPSEPVVWTGKP